jgi:dynein heavy chain
MAPTGDGQLVVGMLRIMACVLEDAIKGQDPGKPEVGDDAIAMKLRKQQIECAFLFGLVWSVGCSSDQQHKFSDFLNELVADVDSLEKNHKGVFVATQLKKWAKPSFGDAELLDGTFLKPCPTDDGAHVHDYVYLPLKGKWVLWTEVLDKHEISPNTPFASITVPTATTAKVSHLLKLTLTRQIKVLVCGPTGTGKSSYVFDTITRQLDQELYKPVMLGFSAKTSAHMTQDIIDGKLMKRRKGVFGPPMGATALIFVDDLNMPEVETYGAQPPIELLRQMVDNGGYYDLKEKDWRSIVDCVLVCAMVCMGSYTLNATALTKAPALGLFFLSCLRCHCL